MRRIVMGAVLPLALASAPLAAQELPGNRMTLEPYAGAFVDPFDISPDGEHVGVLLGLRLGYDLGSRARLLADAGYVGSRNVSDPSGLESHHLYDNTWALTTVGAEYDVVPGRTGLALGLRAGAGWRRVDHAGQVGDPGEQQRQDGGGFSAVDLVVPSLTVRHEITERAALRLTLADNMFDLLEGPTEHSPSISLGVSLR